MMKFFAALIPLFLLNTMAFAEQQIFTDNYELSIPDDAAYHLAGESYEDVVASLKTDITHIVHNAYELNHFPVRPEQVLPKVIFQNPIIHIEHEDVDIFVFTVDVPVPRIFRNILLRHWFSTDIYTDSDLGYSLRLHKERSGSHSDVGIILARATHAESLESPEIDSMIKSFSAF